MAELMTGKERERLNRLKARREWLLQRIEYRGPEESDRDKAESSALLWAIEIIEKYFMLQDYENKCTSESK